MYLKQLPEYLRAIKYNKSSKLVPLCIVSLLITLTELFSIILIFPIIQAFLDFQSFSSGRFANLFSQFLYIYNPSHIAIVLVAMLALTVIFRGLLSYFGYRWIFKVISIDEATFAVQEYRKLLGRDFLSFQKTETSKIIRDIAIAIPNGFSTVLQALLVIISETFVFTGISIYLLILNPLFFVTVLGFLGVAAIIYGKVIGPVLNRLGRERHEVTHKTIGTISQSLEGIGQIKNWQGEKFFADIFQSQRHNQARIVAAQMAMQYIPKLYFETLIMMIICSALLYFLSSDIEVKAFLPLLGFYVVAAFRSLPSVLRISAQYNVLVSSRPGFETVLSLGSTDEDKSHVENKFGNVRISEGLLLKDISFSYGDTLVIHNLNLQLKKGEMIGISGRSGEGKTTLINIIVGLIPVLQGQIFIDDKALIHSDQGILLTLAGYVSQNTFLLNDTIRANVAFGVNSADIDDEKVVCALASAQLDEFVRGLPENIYYIVGERGGRLSGGQRQRLGIARAFYFNRDILILDEATASLDKETEFSFVNVLKSLKGKKTVIVVSHKLEPLSICDKVYDMKEGSLLLIQEAL